MAQQPAVYRSEGDTITFTPAAAHLGGDVIVFGTDFVTVAVDDYTAEDLAAGKPAHVYTRGVINFPKDDSDLAAGVPVYWDDDADPVDGDSGTGALSDSSADGPLAGFTLAAAGTTVGDVDVSLRSVDSATVPGVLAAFPTRTVAAAGGNIATAAAIAGTGVTLVTASDNAKGVQLPATPTGKLVTLKNSVTTATVEVYPQVNSQILGLNANAAYTMPNGSVRNFWGYNATVWVTDPETIA